MIMRKTILIPFLIIPAFLAAQSAKVQTAWRNLEDYQSTKDEVSLMKAKEAIDLASAHADTKDKAKTQVYRAKVYYYIFQNNLKKEKEKLKDIVDKNQKEEMAYGNVSTVEYEEAGKSMERAVELDKDKAYQAEMAMVGMSMIMDVSNLAVGKFKVKKYAEAHEFFAASYEMNKMMGKKDTNALFNASLAAVKAADNAKAKEYTQKMIDEKVANEVTYQILYDAKIALKDVDGANATLKEGRAAFPNDKILLNKEIDYYLEKGNSQDALNMLQIAIDKDPKNSILYFVSANLYNTMANPNDATGKELAKPANFEELLVKSETFYKKASELAPTNFDIWFNMGAMYNNWGGVYQKKANESLKQTPEVKKQEERAMALFNLAVPALEKALEIKADDRSTMVPLRKLYLIIGKADKADEMNKRLKK